MYYFVQLSEKAKNCPNHFISGKQFQIRPNLADLAFLKAKWQPCWPTYKQHPNSHALSRTCTCSRVLASPSCNIKFGPYFNLIFYKFWKACKLIKAHKNLHIDISHLCEIIYNGQGLLKSKCIKGQYPMCEGKTSFRPVCICHWRPL